MSLLWAKILIVGVPFALSLAWFLFWVISIRRAEKRLREKRRGPTQ
jgi:hypothetical protein